MLPAFKMMTMKPFNKRESLKRLEEIGNLPDGWNDSGARSFPAEFLTYVRCILSGLEVDPDIFPTARDSIQLEYDNTSGDYLEFEIFADRKIKKFYCSRNGETSTDFVSASQLKGILNQFYG